MTSCTIFTSRATIAAALLCVAQADALAQSGTTNSPGARQSSATEGRNAAKLAPAEKLFVMEAAKGGLAEVALGEMALQKGGSDSVKQFGARMSADHGKANDQLKAIASSKGLELPSPPRRMPTRADSKACQARTSTVPT